MEQTKRDKMLIAAVAQNDSQALDVLFKAYLPMVYHTVAPYYIRLFDEDDWLQEARIVCYETCQCYDCQKGKSFGSFYKLRFKNHILNLLRRELAQKRRGDRQAVLIAERPEHDAISEDTMTYYQSQFELRCYLETLSPFELVSFRVLTGQLLIDEACCQLDCTIDQLKRGQSRCQTKLKRYYQENR